MRETIFALELRVEGFFGADANVSGGGALAGVHLGASSWFARSPWGLLYMGGAEVGAMSSWTTVSVPASFSLEVGPELLLGGNHRTGMILSLAWAPRLLYNFAGGEALSPYGAELALRISRVTIPLWFLQTSDQTSFVGLGLAYHLL